MRTHFILLGLLCFCALTISQECRRQLLENTDFPGSDIKFLYSSDVDHCQQLCTQHPSCRFFTFVRPDSADTSSHFQCYLKSTQSERPSVESTLHGVTSGYSLKPCSTDSNPCLTQVHHGVDFYGADYRALFTADYEECQRVCTQDPGCQFFTFVEELFDSEKIRYKCHLKFSWTVPRITRIKPKAGLVSGFSHNIQNTQGSDTASRAKLFPNTDILGSDIENLPAASPEHCHAFCTANPRCTYFSYDSNEFRCYLKNNPEEMVMSAKNGIISGMPAGSRQLDYTWVKMTQAGVDFWGSDYHDVAADDADDCQRSCNEDQNCQFFTYVTDSFVDSNIRRICYLKRDITMPAPPKVAKKAYVVSGFSLKNCAFSALTPKTVEGISVSFT
uniref:plasma kallikrein-like n=1 Tax=Scatophagus argus TaxID=75038 RepID=UPI001ED80261|nr:plasma kallikrein-like [Scatophagus argus]